MGKPAAPSIASRTWIIVMRTFLFVIIVVFSGGSALSAENSIQLRPYQREISLAGFARPRQTLTVTGEVSARCTRILVDVGDTVGGSGVIAELDATFAKLDIEENAIAQKKAGRQLELEKKTVARYTSLINKQSAAQATFDEASLRADILLLTLKELKVKELRLHELQKRHVLYGPPGWEVMARFVEQGELVEKGMPVVRLGDFRQLLVPFLLTHEELELLQQRPSIEVYSQDLGRAVSGKIHRVGPDFDEQSRKVPVELLVEGISSKGSALRGGMRVTLKLPGREEAGVFVVPPGALIRRYEASWLVTVEGIRKKVIVLGRVSNDGYAIVSGEGLAEGDSFLAFPEAARQESPGPSGR